MEKDLRQTASNIIRVAFVGPESTGKTTLSQKLAEHFQTEWVPEYMRTYLQKKWDETQEVCTWNDLIPIARGQMISENALIRNAKKFIFCDTNLLELMIYSYIYYEKCPSEIEKYALENQYDIVFLTYIDVPWQSDDLRDKPNEREYIYHQFRQMLDNQNIKYVILKGSIDERTQKVIEILQML